MSDTPSPTDGTTGGTKTAVPAMEGWFAPEADPPHLIGTRCTKSGTYFFPPEHTMSRVPGFADSPLEEVALSRTGTLWSYTNAGYQPPEPYLPVTDPFEPFAIAAVELAEEQMVVLGQVVADVAVEDLEVGHGDGAGRRRRSTRTMSTGTWSGSGSRPAATGAATDERRSEGHRSRHPRRRHAPVGQVGQQLRRVRRGRDPRGARRRRRRLDATSSSSPARRRCATATPGYVAGATFAQALGWTGVQVSSSYAACASGTQAIALGARPDPGRHVRRGPGRRRRHDAQGLPRPQPRASAATTRTGCASACSAPPTPPTSGSTPGAAWTSTAPPRRTSPPSR